MTLRVTRRFVAAGLHLDDDGADRAGLDAAPAADAGLAVDGVRDDLSKVGRGTEGARRFVQRCFEDAAHGAHLDAGVADRAVLDDDGRQEAAVQAAQPFYQRRLAAERGLDLYVEFEALAGAVRLAAVRPRTGRPRDHPQRPGLPPWGGGGR